MALSMRIWLCRPLRPNVANYCKFRVDSGELRVSNLSRRLRWREKHVGRYLPCSFYSQQADSDTKKTQTPAPGTKPGLVKRMLLQTDNAFCKVLGKISPWMLQEYMLFKIGLVQFTADAKSVYYINRRIKREQLQLKDLHWKELYLKKQISNGIIKMTPTLIALCLPIVYYFVLPLMFLYPTVFLSNQFLSREKLLQYYLASYRRRAALYPTLLELLGKRTAQIQGGESGDCLQAAITRLRSEQQIPPEEVVLTREAFRQIALRKLPRTHLKYLCNLWCLRTMFMPGFLLHRKLAKNLAIVQAMDCSLHQEGLLTLDNLQIEKLCYERGLNVVHSDRAEMEDWLGRWLRLSAETKEDDMSLMAHSVALMVIGHPTCSRLQDIDSPATKTVEKPPRDV